MPVSYPRDWSHPPFFSEHPSSQRVHSWEKLESKWATIELCQTQLWQALLQLTVDLLVSLCMSVPTVYPVCWYLFPPCFSLESQSHHASPCLVYIRLTVGYWIVVTVNDNSVVQDRNGSKTNLQDGLQTGRENKSRSFTKERWEKWGGGIWKQRGHKVGEKKRGESLEKLLRGERERREGGSGGRRKKWRKEKTWELWEREADGAVSDAKGWDGICSKVRAKANVQLSRSIVLFKNIFRSLCDLFQRTRQRSKMSERRRKTERG